MQASLSPRATAPAAASAWRRSSRRLAGWTVELLADLVRGPAGCDAQAEPLPHPARYRHPVLGCTWDGRGRQPQWLRDAVLHEGYLLAQLRIRPC